MIKFGSLKMDASLNRTFLILLLLVSSTIYSQKINIKKVTLDDVRNTICEFDTTANAIILYKSRQTYFETNKHGEWNVITEISKRVKILKKEGLQYGIEKIKLIRARDRRENIRGVKVTAYNIKRGKLISNKLKKGDILEDEISKDNIEVTLEAPITKVGSIVDFKYKIISPFFKINDLAIQENIPIKRYFANIKIPLYFSYRRLLIGNPKLKSNESEQFRDIKTMFTKKHFENAVGGGFKKVVKDSILQIKEHEAQYELVDVPAFTKRELDNKKNRFRIIYELISTNFSKNN